MENKVDFYAVSFVKDAQVVHELKKYLQSKYMKPILSLSECFAYESFVLTMIFLLQFFWQVVVLIYM